MIKNCRIIKDLAQGGQKTVKLAEHPNFGLVVIKHGPIKSFTSLERIKREVELLTVLRSDFYPRQHHFSIDVKTREFEIVEEYIEGGTLREAMGTLKSTDEIFRLIYGLTEGLKIIWDKNIVHRDLKPENIIIRPDGRPCIIDLGIARFLDLEALTKTISPLGPCTPVYAAPEQLSNNKRIIDARTDFFALGIIALELYLGVHPFDPIFVGNQYSIVENILQNKFILEKDNVSCDKRMSDFIQKILQLQPYQRFRNYQMLQSYISQNVIS
ncbi:protein containing protein kinase domain [Bacteroidales bacterium 6E]|nr:protein containing protein kinase domain [Bacteroidales bacterium 6E]